MAYSHDEPTASYTKLLPADSEDGAHHSRRYLAQPSRWPIIHGVLIVLYTIGFVFSMWKIGSEGSLEKHWLYCK
jgi:hypothetical protein